MKEETKNKKHSNMHEMLSRSSTPRRSKPSYKTLFPCFQALLVAATFGTFNPKEPLPTYDADSTKPALVNNENKEDIMDFTLGIVPDLRDTYLDYYDDGQIKSERIKERGVLYRKDYYKNGHLRFESVIDGTDYVKKSYLSNGELSLIREHKDGVSSVYNYSDGKLTSSSHEENGITKTITYDQNGQSTSESTSKNRNGKEEQKTSSAEKNNAAQYLQAIRNTGR